MSHTFEHNKLPCNEETVEISKGKKSCKVINFTVHCNGSDIGNGVGIGNGNLNGGGGGCGCGGDGGQTGITGITGITGNTGDGPVCDSKCNLICEQIYLEQTASPVTVSRIGQEITWRFRATNVSGRRILGALVISSSLLGTIFLSDTGIDSGQTITVVRKITLDQEYSQSNPLTSVAFVAAGLPTGIPGNYTPGTRVSPIVVASVYINLPQLELIGNLNVLVGDTGNDIRLQLTVTNTGNLAVTFFSANLSDIFVGQDDQECTPVIEEVGSPFIVEDKQLILTSPQIGSGQSLSVTLIASNCPACLQCCIGSVLPLGCLIEYSYNAEQGPTVDEAIRVSVNTVIA